MKANFRATISVVMLITPDLMPKPKPDSVWVLFVLVKALIWMYTASVYLWLFYNYKFISVVESIMIREDFNLIEIPEFF